MAVEVVELSFEQREKLPDEDGTTRHPLVIGAAAVMVRAVEPGAWQPIDKPPEQRFVTNVHAEGHLRLLAIAPE